MIITVTGSRDWSWREVVAEEMENAYLRYQPVEVEAFESLLIVQGKARRGVDAFARRAYLSMRKVGWPVEIKDFEADWDTYGTKAGPIRNAEMIDWVSKQDDPRKLVLGFNYNESPGTTNCLWLARKKNLEVVEFELKKKVTP